jgi:hypothetical protein
MKKNILVFIIVFMIFVNFGFSKKVATFSEVLKPSTIAIDDEQMYIVENTLIYIYSLKDFKLKKKFGKDGEGPGEFKRFAAVYPQKDSLLINSFGKLSYYTKDGILKKELKTKSGIASLFFYPIRNGFIGRGISLVDKKIYFTVNLFDSDLNKGKELYRMISPYQQTGKINIFSRSLVYQTHSDKIFITGKEGFGLDILDSTGKKLYSIVREDYKRRKFTSEDEKKFREVLKSRFKAQYDIMKSRISFPDYFPEILNFFIADNKIYISTWKWKNEKIEFFIYGLKGKLLKHVFIPFVFQNALEPYPAVIKNGKLYQLIENDDEEWELFITDIK